MSLPKYRPQSGSEGIDFQDRFCCNCRHEDYPKVCCDILSRSMEFEINDPEYPAEWTYDDNGQPTCTAFEPRH